MKYDPFEIHSDMPAEARWRRIVLLAVIAVVCMLDLFVWRPM